MADNMRLTDTDYQEFPLIRTYNYYRISLALALLISFVEDFGLELLGEEKPDLYLFTASVYLGFNLIFGLFGLIFSTPMFQDVKVARRDLVLLVVVAIDIICLTILMYASGGVQSGLGSLIIVAVAVSSVLIIGSLGAVLPAIATISVIYEEFYLSLTPLGDHDYVQAGILGVIFFGASFFIQKISIKVRESEALARERAHAIVRLQKLNNKIIQRMNVGLLVVTRGFDVELKNNAARSLLGEKAPDHQNHQEVLPELNMELRELIKQWQQSPKANLKTFHTAHSGAEILPSFVALEDDDNTTILVLLQDYTALARQAQQLKLASLGRLTASIAHEIRNPLGAISHAAQLLIESPNLDKHDSRLLDIIQNHSKRMNGVIENILQMSRRNPAKPIQITMKQFVEEFWSDFKETLDEQPVLQLDLPDQDIILEIDTLQLNQVLTNLAANGLRYSKANTGKATLTLEGGLTPNNALPYLNVIDQGAGIDNDKAKHLFEPFYTTESSGTGLGLYLSKELCEANNANLIHVPQQDKGTCFRIVFSQATLD